MSVAGPAIIPGQSKNAHPTKPLTVCEVLGNPNQQGDTAIAVVGRMESSVGLEDHYEFLTQDHCEHPVTTGRHVWPNKIEIWDRWEEGMPKPPSDKPVLNHADLVAKLSAVRKSTTLGFHEEPQIETKGGSTKVSIVHVPNEWAVAYGRLVKLPDLDRDCGPEGCGGDDVPLMIVVKPYNVHCLRDDGTLLPDSDTESQ